MRSIPGPAGRNEHPGGSYQTRISQEDGQKCSGAKVDNETWTEALQSLGMPCQGEVLIIRLKLVLEAGGR